MAVVIRLKRFGTKKFPFFRIVAITKSNQRDGETLEEFGYYDPKKGKNYISIDRERFDYWVGKGAVPSRTVTNILKKVKL
ncbi:MAG: 30S ribosomal protein S16 [Candidatus Omnitrophica bacterium]|nr:30S ribosomal protein S16 [Candidatus Omnitrophota bacterium]